MTIGLTAVADAAKIWLGIYTREIHMARFLIGTIPIVGHVSPALPIARRLVERGHDVWWYTGRAFQSVVEATGAHFAPIVSWLDYSDPQNVPPSLTEQRNAVRGLAQLKFDLRHFFIDPALGQVKDLREILQTFPADVLLADFCFLGASWVSEQGGPPWAGFGISALAFTSQDTAPFGLGLLPNASPLGHVRNRSLNWLFQQVVFRDLTAYLDSIRVSLGLPACRRGFFDTLSPFLHLAGTIPEFEYPRSDLPPQVHFTGPLLPTLAIDFTPPAWWHELTGDTPIVHVTQGTVATNPTDLIVPTLRALEEEDVLVVATTASESIDLAQFAPIPANARIEPFLPYTHLLPHVDVMVTNGGFNGVQMALAHSIPLIAAGKSEDKPEVCARIAWSGAGIDLKTKTPTPKQIKDAVKQLLTNPSYKTSAKHLQAAIQRYDAPTIAATLLEQLADTKQPILRESVAS